MVKHFDRNATVVELMAKYIDDATLHTLSQAELTDMFSSVLKSDNSIYTDNASQYNDSAIESKERYDSIPIDLTGLTNTQIKERTSQRESYWHELERAERVLEGLDAEVKEISEVAAKEARELKDLENDLGVLVFDTTAGRYNFDLDSAEGVIFSTVGGQRNPDLSLIENALTTYDYENNGKVAANLEKLENTLVGDYSLINLYKKRSEVQPIVKELKDTRSNLQKSAETDIKDHFKKYDDDITGGYKKAKKDLGEYVPAPGTNLNHAWLNVLRFYGKKLVSGTALNDAEKKNKDYKKISNAYINLKIGEAYGNPDYIEAELTRIDAIASRKDALKELTALQEDIDSVKDGVLETLDEELKDAYKNVIMGSSLDDENNNTGEFEWFMFMGEKKVVDNHEIGTYAQAGLGFFYERFIGAGHVNLDAGVKSIVEKHKRKSSWLYGGFFNRKKNNRIGVDEVLEMGLGYAVQMSDREDIEAQISDKWANILLLDDTAWIENILFAYREASKLGEELNDDAEEWTKRETRGYNLIDNKVNELSGFSFNVVDKVWDYVGRKIPEFLRKEEEKYEVDITAIEPQWHPHLQLALGSLGLAAAAYLSINAIWDIVQAEDKPLSDKLAEIIKEIGIATGVGLVIKEGSKTEGTKHT